MQNKVRSQIIRFTNDKFHFRCIYQNNTQNSLEVRDVTLNPGGEGEQEVIKKLGKGDIVEALQSLIDFEKEWQQNAQSQKIEGPIFLSANELAQEYHRVFDTPCLKDVMGEYNAHLDAEGRLYTYAENNITTDADFNSIAAVDEAHTRQKASEKITAITDYFNNLAEKIATQHIQQELQSGRKIEDIKTEEFTNHILDLTIGIEETLDMAMKYIGNSAAEILDINDRISEQLTPEALSSLHGKTAQLYLIEKMIEAGQQSYKEVVNGNYAHITDLEGLKATITDKLNSIDMATEAQNCHDLMTTTQKIDEQGFFVNRMQTAFENAINKQKETNGADGQKAARLKPGAARRMKSLFSFGKGR